MYKLDPDTIEVEWWSTDGDESRPNKGRSSWTR